MFSLTSKRPLMSLLWSRSCRKILESAKGLATKAGSTSNTSDSAHQKERPESGPESTENQELQFAASRRGSFFQVEPKLGNQFSRDVFLASYLERVVPGDVFKEISQDLERFGNRVATDVYEMGRDAELNPPDLQHFDAWGRRVDQLITSEGWRKLHDVSAEEGLIAIAYERKYRQWSRLYQSVKLYLFSPSSGLYSCPLAMTDGAATILENPNLTGERFKQAYKRLTSRVPSEFWTSGQWMTERMGGSDVANGTETVAVPQDDGSYKLFGYKWFSSATDADISLTLARVQQTGYSTVPGSKGLTMFCLETRKSDGTLNNIEIQRLKNKLGTRQLPTAELLLHGTVAHKITKEGRGVAGIADMLTITRLHNGISAVSAMRRILSLAQDYCLKRSVFGKLLVHHPLHMQTLARIEVETRAAFLLVMECFQLLGRQECGQASDTELYLLRLLTPITKLYTAKQAMSVISEGLECFGGQGYIEDTGLPGLLRDAQVLPIWEGTTNVLSLDVLRSISKSEGQVLKSFYNSVVGKISVVRNLRPSLVPLCDGVSKSVEETLASRHTESFLQPSAARDLAFSLARIYMATLLLEYGAHKGAMEHDIEAARRWCQKDLSPVVTNFRYVNYHTESTVCDRALAMEGHPEFTAVSNRSSK